MRNSRAFGWFRSFLRIANLRVLYILLVDMPLSVFLVLYSSQVNAPDGLCVRVTVGKWQISC